MYILWLIKTLKNNFTVYINTKIECIFGVHCKQKPILNK